MPTAAPTITDARFNALKAKLRELFELDKSDLDFGIYRIMAAKNAEVTDFLDRQLKDVVRETLAAHGVQATEQVQAELDETIEQLRKLKVDPDTNETVQELRARLDAAAGAAGADLEADIYNHLLAFFSRYYDEGDFISKRRYKGDTYAIPYSGEEVVLHWANKDQYYIKSGEWHKDYRFRLPGAGNGKTVRFKLIEATQEAANNKEPDESKRRYILDHDNPIEATDISGGGGELVLRFQFRAPTEAEKSAVEESETTRIFGGKYDRSGGGRTKGDEREQFCADAERRALDAMPEEWNRLVSAAAATDAKPNRTILGKHLDEFTARNTFDYFIHKDLGGFLRRELDFYIKNEVVRLDDLEALDDAHLAQVQSKIKAIRKVAGRIIDFLAAIENFQKKMWLKKKLVLETNWLVTIDRIPGGSAGSGASAEARGASTAGLGTSPNDPGPSPQGAGTSAKAAGVSPTVPGTSPSHAGASPQAVGNSPHGVGEPARDAGDSPDGTVARSLRSGDLRQAVADNPRQWQQWEDLGFKPSEDSELLLKGPEWGTREYLDTHPNLVVDTALFDASFKAELLASEEVLGSGDAQSIEEATTGLLVQADNFGALNLLAHWGDGRVPFIYLDPPYNTERDRLEGKFIYKDGFEHSSWSTLFRDRLECACRLLKADDFALMVSLDENELPQAAKHAPFAKLQGFFTWRRTRTGGHLSKSFNQLSDYVLVFTPDGGPGSWLFGGRADPEESQPLTKKTNRMSELVFAPRTVEFLDLEDGEIAAGTYSEGYVEVTNPIQVVQHRNAEEIRINAPFTWQQSMLDAELERGARMIVKRHKNMNIRFFREAEGHKPLPSLADGEFDVGTNEDASSMLADLLGYEVQGAYPKPVRLIERLVTAKSAFIPDMLCLDYFAGSGTTGHAVLNLNRADKQSRRVILVEMGSQFHSILLPRFAKVIYSPDWKDGQAQSHDKGLPGGALVKYFALESYEDALNNLPAPDADDSVLAGLNAEARQAMLTYALDLELGPHLLNLNAFRDPWMYTINAQLAGEDEITPHRVDLIETFNYLLGLKVRSYGPIERYSAEFERAVHDDDLGRLKLSGGGRLRRDQDGPYCFQRVEGELNDGNDTRVLVVWRTLTDDPEKDAAVLEAWMERHREDTRQRSEHRDYHLIYINGPVTLPQPTAEIRTVFPIEETFKAKMFEDTDNAGGL